MSAFDQILTAEKESELAILKAKEEVVTQIKQAKLDSRNKIEAEILRLETQSQEENVSKQKQINNLVEKIQTETKTQITVVEKVFAAHKDNLKTLLLSNF